MFVSEIQSRVKNLFGDTAGVQITDAMTLEWINDGQLDIARKTECLEGSYSINSVAGTMGYALPTDFFKDIRVTYDGMPMRKTTQGYMDTFWAGHEKTPVSQGTPIFYYFFAGQINIYPAPAANLTNGIVLNYVKIPAVLTGSAQTPEIPDEFHGNIVTYSHWRALQQDEQWPAADRLKQEYDEAVLSSIHDTHVTEKDSYPSVNLIAGDW